MLACYRKVELVICAVMLRLLSTHSSSQDSLRHSQADAVGTGSTLPLQPCTCRSQCQRYAHSLCALSGQKFKYHIDGKSRKEQQKKDVRKRLHARNVGNRQANNWGLRPQGERVLKFAHVVLGRICRKKQKTVAGTLQGPLAHIYKRLVAGTLQGPFSQTYKRTQGCKRRAGQVKGKVLQRTHVGVK